MAGNRADNSAGRQGSVRKWLNPRRESSKIGKSMRLMEEGSLQLQAKYKIQDIGG